MSNNKTETAVAEIQKIIEEMNVRIDLLSKKELALVKAQKSFDKAKLKYDDALSEVTQAKKSVKEYSATHKKASKKLFDLGSSDPLILQNILSATMNLVKKASVSEDENTEYLDDA